MSQINRSSSQNQFQPKRLHYLTILSNMLSQDSNHESIKETVKKKIKKVQGLTYSSLVDSEQKYIQKLGTFSHDPNLIGYICKLLNSKQMDFFAQYDGGLFQIKSNIKPPPQPQPRPPQEMLNQVEYVLANVDLPLSLFKRNDKYWSIDNPKTLEAKEYLRKLKEQDAKFKSQMKQKKVEIMKEKQELRNKSLESIKNQEQNQKKQLQQKVQDKIQELKRNSQNRKKAISESVEFMKQRGQPLFKKIQREFQQKVQLPTLEQKKRKLSEVRQIMRSVPLQEIQQHRSRYQKQRSERQHRTIVNEPLNISFKSHFYEQIKSMSTSRFNELQSNLSLYQKKLEYSRMVKQQHKPSIDDTKKEEIQNRIKLMNKRRARLKKNQKQQKNSDQDDQDEEEEPEPEQQSEEEPEPQENSDDDSDKPKPEKNDQYEPSHKERYKMGLNYLKVARTLAAKKPQSRQNAENSGQTKRINTATQNQTIHFNSTIDNKEGQETVQPQPKKQKFVWVSKYDEEQKKEERIKYKNYLHEMVKPNQSSNPMDTSRMRKQLQKSLDTAMSRSKVQSRYEQSRKSPDIQAEIMYHTNLQNKIRSIEQRARNEEELLRFKRINKTQKIQKKMAIDDAVVDTIKARLMMMNKTLDV